MPKLFEELEILCDADKRKSTNELPRQKKKHQRIAVRQCSHASRFIFEMDRKT